MPTAMFTKDPANFSWLKSKMLKLSPCSCTYVYNYYMHLKIVFLPTSQN